MYSSTWFESKHLLKACREKISHESLLKPLKHFINPTSSCHGRLGISKRYYSTYPQDHLSQPSRYQLFFPHSDLAGEQFKFPLLGEFINAWNSLLPIVLKLVCVGGSNVEEYAIIPSGGANGNELFGDIEPFVSTHVDLQLHARSFLQFLQIPQRMPVLVERLAAVIDAGECLVKTTYKLRTR